MKILIIGTGGREHAITRRLSRDSVSHELHAAPGNPGMAEVATVHSVDVKDHGSVLALAKKLGIELVVVGPEAPLVDGLADSLRDGGIAVYGPSQAAAELEGSKDFAKKVMERAGVPTARSRTIESVSEIGEALDDINPGGTVPYVVKDDGLAAGKGVVVTLSRDEAEAHAAACLEKSGGRVVLEEYLDGPELSVFCVCDGTTVVPLVPAQDFKRAFRGDEGPNTGGMGAYTPLPWLDEDAAMRSTLEQVALPTMKTMADDGKPFVGTLFCGLAATKDGLKVIEFNVRFGDPETQVVLDRLASDLGPLLFAAATGTLAQHPPLEWRSDSTVTVVLASEGYPVTSRSGDEITGLEDAVDSGAYVIHAGTAREADGRLLSAGGRVLCVVTSGESLHDARVSAQSAIARVSLVGSHYRTDIAEKAANNEIEKVDLA